MEVIQRMVRSKLFLEKHYAEALPLKRLAAEAFLSPYHYLRSFKKIFGATPHRYLSGWRLHKARLLLEQGRHSVTEVCYRAGFSSIGSFSLQFKRRYGISPGCCRQGAIRRQEQLARLPLHFIPPCYIRHLRGDDKVDANSNFE